MSNKIKNNKVLGIDLGTTNSCIAIMEGGEPIVIPNSEGARTTPSIVAFTKKGEKVVGASAKRQMVTNPQNTIFSAKRLIGHKLSEVKELAKNLPYKLVEGKNGAVLIECDINGKKEQLAPEHISAMILSKLKADAESYLGEKITQAVITVPAYFNDSQRQATKDAGAIAGLEVLRIINEPTAASLAYGLDKKKDEKIAVYDLGGGTFDISILEIGDGVFEVKATNGDTKLGGDNWDEEIISYFINEFKKENGIDLSKDSMALQRLKEEAEKAKIALSSVQQIDINLPFITADASGPKHLNITLSRSKLDQLTDVLCSRTIEPVNKCIIDSGIKVEDIDELVLVGGMTRMPKILETAKKLAGKDPHQGVNPDEVVAIGAAIQGAVLKGDMRDILLLDVSPLTLGIETAGGVSTPMIERNTTIPTKKSQVFTTYADNQTSVDIKILQGERPLSTQNKLLGNFRLDGIAGAPRGTPQIEVTFDIDANGILHVTAKDKGTGKDQKITITGASGLSKEEVENLKREAESNAENDLKLKELIEARNQLDNVIFQIEKDIKSNESKIEKDIKSKIESIIIDAKKVLVNQNASKDELKNAFEKVSTESQKIQQMIYSQTNNSNVANEVNSEQNKKSDKNENKNIVDAEIINEDENKQSTKDQ